MEQMLAIPLGREAKHQVCSYIEIEFVCLRRFKLDLTVRVEDLIGERSIVTGLQRTLPENHIEFMLLTLRDGECVEAVV